MKIIFVFIFFFLSLVSCMEKKAEERKPGPVIEKSEKIDLVSEKPYRNPVFMYGSDFGRLFQSYYKIGDFDKMLSFTSSLSIKKFGKVEILNSYRTMDFAYDIKLKSMNKNPDSSITLNYIKQEFATKKMLRINIVVENDTCKLLINSLEPDQIFLQQ